MFDPLKWPKDCPPQEAIPPSGNLFFRVVKTDPPPPDDFLTNEELGKKQNAPLCKRKAVSLNATLGDAQALMSLYPAMGRFIAELFLSNGDGVILAGRGGHVAWWPCDPVDAAGPLCPGHSDVLAHFAEHNMWQCAGKQIAAPVAVPFDIERVLFEFDGPRTFTVRTASGLFLVHWCDEDRENRVTRYLLTSITESRLADLEMGILPLHMVFSGGECVLLDVSFDETTIVQAAEGDYLSVPEGCRPRPDATLPRIVDPSSLSA